MIWHLFFGHWSQSENLYEMKPPLYFKFEGLGYKGGFISERFSLWLQCPKKGAKSLKTSCSGQWFVAFFLEIGAKVKNSKDQATFSHIPCMISPSLDFQCFLCLKVCWHILYQVEFFVKLKNVGQQPPCMLFYRNEMRKVHFGRSSHTREAS